MFAILAMRLVIKVPIAPNVRREGKDIVEAALAEKSVEKVFLEVAVEKVMERSMMEVEASNG